LFYKYAIKETKLVFHWILRKCQISLSYGDLIKDLHEEAWQNHLSAEPNDSSFILNIFIYRVNRVALIHCCSAHYAWSHTDRPNLRRWASQKDRLDKEYKSYAVSTVNIFYWSNGTEPVRKKKKMCIVCAVALDGRRILYLVNISDHEIIHSQ